jgi:transposase
MKDITTIGVDLAKNVFQVHAADRCARAEIRATLKYKGEQNSIYHNWIAQLVGRVGKNKAAVALANKHARIIWAILKYKRMFNADFAKVFNLAA